MKHIKEYGETVSIKNYTDGLQGHAYIPQSDECIAQIIENYTYGGDILDLGCGPGRLTLPIAHRNREKNFLGIDQSSSFLGKLLEKNMFENISFQVGNFEDIPVGDISGLQKGKFGVIFMQGVLHHLHGHIRKLWFEKIFELLGDNGILIVGDEYIPDFSTELERKDKLSLFYAHIIGEAKNGGFTVLAEEEAKNLIDDITGGEEGAGVGTPELLREIIETSCKINTNLYTNIDVARKDATKLKVRILEATKALQSKEHMPNFYRGDFKVSIKKNIEEIEKFGFRKKEIYTFGPVDTIGGMGVIVFGK